MNKQQAQIEQVGVDVLIPYAKNARTHSAEQVSQIASSIKEFGFTNPVLIDAGGGIIAGHGRVLAAKKLKHKTIPCLRLAHLSEAQKRAYIIADNKLALNAGWDDAMLAKELVELATEGFPHEDLGFTDEELARLLSDGADPIDVSTGSGEGEGSGEKCTKCGQSV